MRYTGADFEEVTKTTVSHKLARCCIRHVRLGMSERPSVRLIFLTSGGTASYVISDQTAGVRIGAVSPVYLCRRLSGFNG